MGTPILPEMIDQEIEEIINVHMNEAFDFIQTISCCSGWSSLDDNTSRTEEKKWVGNPYVYFEILDNQRGLAEFIPFIMYRLIWDTNNVFALGYESYSNRLNLVGFEDDDEQLVHFILEYRSGKINVGMFLYTKDRTPEQIGKIWEIIKNVLIEYKTHANNIS